MPKEALGKAGTRMVHPGGYVLWNNDTYALKDDLLSSFQGDRVLVVETETAIGIAFESLKDSDLMPAIKVSVQAKIKPVD